MRKLGRTRVWIGMGAVLLIGCFVAGSANAGLFGLFRGRSSRHSVSRPSSLIVFPFDQAANIKAPVGMGGELAAALRTLLNGNETYSPILYKEKLSPIKRAREDGTLKPNDDVSPFSDDRSKSLKLARLLAADYFIIGAIEDVKVDPFKRTAEMTLSMDLMDARSGKLVKTLLVSGLTPANSTSASQEDAVAIAAGDAITKLKAQLLEETKVSPTPAGAAAFRVTPPENTEPGKPNVSARGNSGSPPPSPTGVRVPTGTGGPPTPTDAGNASTAGEAGSGDGGSVETPVGDGSTDQPVPTPPAAPTD